MRITAPAKHDCLSAALKLFDRGWPLLSTVVTVQVLPVPLEQVAVACFQQLEEDGAGVLYDRRYDAPRAERLHDDERPRGGDSWTETRVNVRFMLAKDFCVAKIGHLRDRSFIFPLAPPHAVCFALDCMIVTVRSVKLRSGP